MSTITIIGSASDFDTFFCQTVAKKIVKADASVSMQFDLHLEVDYKRRLRILTQQIGGEIYTHRFNHLVLRDGKYIGDIMALIAIAKSEFGIEDAENSNVTVFERHSREETTRLFKETGRPIVFMDFKEDSRAKKTAQFGKIVIELFADLCPHACQNFINLCSGKCGSSGEITLHYLGCPVHRIVPGGWFQCGDIVDGTGSNSFASIHEGKVRDESFSVDFGTEEGGILGYSRSASHSNGSQFFVTLGPCEWMQNSFVGFGRVVQGFQVLKAIENSPTSNQVPELRIVVRDCGLEI